ncbi:Phosphoglucose isomerase (PGI) [Carpediemonas membranifera]|uniref:Glucose-6-phosphate isomerase n=1 Tax=Carpediemonas membranifera TaxID=201153 RepID=A0A8J6E102_9EUKA|nr:Phosphoglucose isomerase (PGI) [Carpediemonas membranifera]|eukprot:KAG9392828.1 Phosphoglucose isomerase (PGI) [Carpediemonas membranifera]
MKLFDPKSEFELSLDGFETVTDELLESQATAFLAKSALAMVEKIEAGEVVNTTVHPTESEDRAVDHYNHRMEASPVAGKSLADSIAQWNTIKTEIDAILDGKTTTPEGKRYTDVIFNGLGGSFLGPLMLVISQYGDEFNFESGLPVRIHFMSNTDPDSYHLLFNKLDVATTVMVSMSKSGSTAETKGATDAWTALVASKGLELGPHSIAVTTPGSMLDKFAQEHKFLGIYYMATETGGRTSIGTAIGMVPAAFARIDFADFLRGQGHMDAMTRRPEVKQNPAMLLAVAIHQMTLMQGSKNMIVLCYSDFLKEFAHYLQQLYMESLGKNYHADGTPAVEGQTVFGGVGTGEQHAFMQQVQKGLRDCFVRFVHFAKRSGDLDNAKAGSVGRQLLAFVKGTEAALHQNGKEFITCTYDEPTPFNIGMMVALEERVVTFLACFKGINAYDQPGVQDGKLAADAMNAFSKDSEAFVAKAGFKGTADDFVTAQGKAVSFETRLMAEAFLSDLTKNPASYKALAGCRASRQFDGEFAYDITV